MNQNDRDDIDLVDWAVIYDNDEPSGISQAVGLVVIGLCLIALCVIVFCFGKEGV